VGRRGWRSGGGGKREQRGWRRDRDGYDGGEQRGWGGVEKDGIRRMDGERDRVEQGRDKEERKGAAWGGKEQKGLASFPGLLHLQFLITCSMRKQREKDWGTVPPDP